MKTYNIVFARDEILLCFECTSDIPNGRDSYYEQSDGRLTYALVKASDLDEATEKASHILSSYNPDIIPANQQISGDPSSGH